MNRPCRKTSIVLSRIVAAALLLGPTLAKADLISDHFRIPVDETNAGGGASVSANYLIPFDSVGGLVESGRSLSAHFVVLSGFLYTMPSPPVAAVRPTDRGYQATRVEPAIPNPILTSARIDYSVAGAANLIGVRMRIINASGRVVRTLVEGQLAPGSHTVWWDRTDQDGRTVPAGLYFYKLEAGGRMAVQRLVVIG